MNLKRRFFDLENPARPATEVSGAAETTIEAEIVSQPIPAEQLASSTAPVTTYERKLEEYRIPWILSALLTDTKNPQILQALRDGLNRAREQGNKFYATIFEGGLAANRVPADVSEAVRCFNHAFDLSGGKTDGFLHGMVWNLFATSGGNEAVSALLERVRSDLRQNSLPHKSLAEALQTTLEALKRIPGFDEQFERFERETAQRQRLGDLRTFRERRLAGDRSMLFFPRTTAPGYDYFVDFHGAGTVIDPTAGFFDTFFQLGGAANDLRNIVFSSVLKIDPRWFAAFRQLFSKRTPEEKIQIFTTSDVVRNFGDPLDELEKAGLIETPRFADRSESELGGGGTVLLQAGSAVLKTPSGRTILFVDPFGTEEFERSDLLDADILISSLDWLSSVHYAKEKRPKLAVFDLPETLAGSIQSFLENAVATASSALVVDVDQLRFLDAVKAFGDPRGDCWTDLSSLAAETDGDEFFFFGQDGRERFEQERSEIVESFRFYRKRRQGLYFA